MRASIITLSTLLGSALAAPSIVRRQDEDCLTAEEAEAMVEIYEALIGDFTVEHAEMYIADEFIDRSDSINTFAGKELGGPTFPSKEVFIAAQSNNPSHPIEIDDVPMVTCDKIAIIWHAAFGEANKSSRGITVLGVTKDSGDWQVSSIDVEFNSLTWLENMGGSYVWDPPARPE